MLQEFAISQLVSQAIHADKAQTESRLQKKMQRLSKRLRAFMGRRKTLRYSLLAGNLLLLAGIAGFVVYGGQNHQSDAAALSSASQNAATDPLDQLSSADIAANLSKTANLPETPAVTNQAQTVNAQLSITPVDNTLVAKPQMVSTATKSRRDIKSYVVAVGDSVTSIAAKFGITSDSVRWSNGLTGDAVTVGTKLTIPPINGIIYTIKSGDTAQTLASRYSANADQITSFNDAELQGLQVGEVIVIPNGQQPVTASAYSSTSTVVYRGSGASYGSGGSCYFKGSTYQNYGYDCGYCTWWVAMKRAMAGNPVPSNLGNASSWGYLAASYGLSVGTTPQVGAAVVTSTSGAGHVAYVEAVNADGTITISEMNHEGWNVSDTRTIAVGRYTYIY